MKFIFLENILELVWEEIMDQKKKEALRKEKKILGKRKNETKGVRHRRESLVTKGVAILIPISIPV